MTKPSVMVLFGGRSSEHSISCLSAGSILAAIDRDQYEVVAVGITEAGDWVLHSGDPDDLRSEAGQLPVVTGEGRVELSLSPQRRGLWVTDAAGGRNWQPVDVVFPVLHGPYGEDGAVQGALEIAGVPFVGSGVFASAACMDKAHTKKLLAAEGIPAGRWHALRHDEWGQEDHRERIAELGWPVFVKPARAGSSVGVSKARDEQELKAAIDAAGAHDPRIIVEASVENALEVECGVLVGPDRVPRASVCARIKVGPEHEFYDFEAKYLDDSVELIVPADIPQVAAAEIQQLAIAAFQAMDCEGLARVDVFVGADGDVSINEINTMPGFTAISMYPRMWQETGVSYQQLVASLIGEALSRRQGLR